MATTLFGWRPSALPAACPSIAPVVNGMRHAALPVYVFGVGAINNSIGTPAVAAEGALLSGFETLAAAATASQRIDADKAKGIGARGNPPRGRRRV